MIILGYNSSFNNADSIQRIYMLPNGYGLSVIRGWMSWYLWETAPIKYNYSFPKNRLPKKKRVKKKWLSKYMTNWELIDDIERYKHFSEVESELKEIAKKESVLFVNNYSEVYREEK